MYAIPQLIPFLIHMEDVWPMEAFQQVAAHVHVQSLGLMAELQEMIIWLLACATPVPGPKAAATCIQALAISLPMPVAETATFRQHRAAKV
jgi:hypothetical protein